jgi:hypothetical protein
MPVHNTSNGLLGSLVGQSALGALGMTQDVDRNEPIQIVASHSLLSRFIEDHSLLPILCSSREIRCKNERAGELLEQEHRMNSAIELFQKKLLSVSENTLTGVVHVSVIWYDRTLAADWCNGLIDLTNAVIQERAKETASLRVKFLKEEYAQISIVALQQAVNTILVNEMTKQMDASTRPQYAWRVISRASIPDDRYPAQPQKAVIGVGAGLGGILFYALVFWLRQRKTQHARAS